MSLLVRERRCSVSFAHRANSLSDSSRCPLSPSHHEDRAGLGMIQAEQHREIVAEVAGQQEMLADELVPRPMRCRFSAYRSR